MNISLDNNESYYDNQDSNKIKEFENPEKLDV